MRQHFLKTIVATGLGLSMALVHAAPAEENRDELKIGFMGVFSGGQAALGQDSYDGFMLYLKNNGGKLGNRPVDVLKADAQIKPVVGVQQAKRLIGKDGVPIVVGVTFSNVMLAVHGPITKKEVFLIGTNAGPSQIAGKECSPYFFSTSYQNDQKAESMGSYAKSQGYKRIITMVPNYQSGFDFVSGFKRYYQAPLLDEIYTPLDQQDFSAELAKIASEQPDAVYVFYPGGLGVNFLRQYQQAGLARFRSCPPRRPTPSIFPPSATAPWASSPAPSGGPTLTMPPTRNSWPSSRRNTNASPLILPRKAMTERNCSIRP